MATRARTKITGRKFAVALLAIFTAMIASSCGKATHEIKNKLPVFPVKGKLVLDGQPMPGAEIFFHPVHEFPKESSQLKPHARADAEGAFQISTYVGQDGAPAGEYYVTVSWKGPLQEGMNSEQRDDLPEKISERFQNPHWSRLKAVVKEGENDLPTWDLAEVERQASNSQ